MQTKARRVLRFGRRDDSRDLRGICINCGKKLTVTLFGVGYETAQCANCTVIYKVQNHALCNTERWIMFVSSPSVCATFGKTVSRRYVINLCVRHPPIVSRLKYPPVPLRQRCLSWQQAICFPCYSQSCHMELPPLWECIP